MKNLAGKTVDTVQYIDPWDNGLRIMFTDGTTLEVTEARQAGQIKVCVNHETMESLNTLGANYEN